MRNNEAAPPVSQAVIDKLIALYTSNKESYRDDTTWDNVLDMICKEAPKPDARHLLLDAFFYLFGNVSYILKFTTRLFPYIFQDYAFPEGTVIDLRGSNCLQSIGTGVFKGCTGLVGFRAPKSLEFLHPYAFENSPLQYADFSEADKLEEIDKAVFLNNSNLKYVQMPPQLNKLDSFAFSGCTSLKRIYLAPDNHPKITNPEYREALDKVDFVHNGTEGKLLSNKKAAIKLVNPKMYYARFNNTLDNPKQFEDLKNVSRKYGVRISILEDSDTLIVGGSAKQLEDWAKNMMFKSLPDAEKKAKEFVTKVQQAANKESRNQPVNDNSNIEEQDK